jgi:Phage integrase, N-terminal SAM-like domain
LEAQRRKRLELDARESNVEFPVLDEVEDAFPLQTLLANFLKDMRAFRKPLTYQKYEHILELFCEYVAPKVDARQITTDDIKRFLAWRKSKGFDPGSVSPVSGRSRSRYTDSELKKFFAACDAWAKAMQSCVQQSAN